MATLRNIRNAYDTIIGSSVFRTDGPDIDIPAAVITLCDAINAYEGDTEDWCYYGEDWECNLSDFLVGAYWCLAERHGGQYSDTYAAMSAIGTIFSPGMTSLESNSSEYTPYEMLNTYFASKYS